MSSSTHGSASDQRLKDRTILIYAIPTTTLGYMFILVNLYLPKFSTDVLLMAPGAMGLMFGVCRLWDAVSDPLVGYLSDRTRTGWGRRRPWMLASALPNALVFILLWAPPESLTGLWLTAWMGGCMFLFYTSQTVFIVPHISLGAELTGEHHDRTRVFGFRHVCWNAGALIALISMYLLIASTEPRTTAIELALIAAVATLIIIPVAVYYIDEKPKFWGKGSDRPLGAFYDILKNEHARLLLLVVLIENLATATIVILTPYVAEYVIGTPSYTPFYILSYMVPTIAFVPLWLKLSRKFGKKPVWMVSMVMVAAAFFGLFFLYRGAVVMMFTLAILAGIAAGCGAIVGPSILADVIDYDEYLTGERKEGTYYAAWNLVFKGATGITVMLMGIVLEFAGFSPNVEQTQTTILAFRSMYGLFPMVCYLVGVVLFARFGFNELEHARIKEELGEMRDSEGESTEPELAAGAASVP